ncbi:MAG: CHAD domain-containing protein [Steroidobacteraceae bacterium]
MRVAASRNPALAAAQLLRQQYQELSTTLAALRSRTSSTRVHDARVAARRLRTTLSALAPEMPRAAQRRLKRDLKSLANELGAARDAEIRAGLVVPLVLDHKRIAVRSERAALRALQAAARDERARLRRILRSAAFERRQSQMDLRAAALLGRLPAQLPAELLLHTDLRRRWSKLRRALKRKPRSYRQLHALRLRVKKCRYLLDSAPGPGSQMAGRWLRRLQDRLGQLHDVVQTRMWLRERRAKLHGGTHLRRALRQQAKTLRAKLRRQLRAVPRKVRTALAEGES